MTKAIAKEVGDTGILVNTVAPGFTMSDGVLANPVQVAEAPGDLGQGARHPARPVPLRRRRGDRVLLLRRLLVHHRPVAGRRRRSVLQLMAALQLQHVDGRRRRHRSSRGGPRGRLRPRRQPAPTPSTAALTVAHGGLQLVWSLVDRAAPRRACSRAEIDLDPGEPPCALRPRRLPARWRRVPAHPPGTRHPLPVDGCSGRDPGHSPRDRPARRLVRGRAPTRSRRGRGDEPAAFVRVMILPARLLGHALDPLRARRGPRPPEAQRYTVFVDEPLDVTRSGGAASRRPAGRARRRAGVLRAGRELPAAARRPLRRTATGCA